MKRKRGRGEDEEERKEKGRYVVVDPQIIYDEEFGCKPVVSRLTLCCMSIGQATGSA